MICVLGGIQFVLCCVVHIIIGLKEKVGLDWTNTEKANNKYHKTVSDLNLQGKGRRGRPKSNRQRETDAVDN